MKSDNVLIMAKGVRMLSETFQTVYGLTYVLLFEAADMIEKLHRENESLKNEIKELKRDS